MVNRKSAAEKRQSFICERVSQNTNISSRARTTENMRSRQSKYIKVCQAGPRWRPNREIAWHTEWLLIRVRYTNSRHSPFSNAITEQSLPVARSLVSANRWLRGTKMYRFPWYLTLVSNKQSFEQPGPE